MNIIVNYHSSIRIDDKKVMYFDPWKIDEALHDADMIFITHNHFDHFSPEDIEKIKKGDTIIIAPETMRDEVLEKIEMDEDFLVAVAPGEELEIDDLQIDVVPAYNIGKDFHKKECGWCGYIVKAEQSYYVAGDTDATPELMAVKADVLLLPVGGKYTMDASEAAECVNHISPKVAIPTHYGEVAGGPECGSKFSDLVRKDIEVKIVL